MRDLDQERDRRDRSIRFTNGSEVRRIVKGSPETRWTVAEVEKMGCLEDIKVETFSFKCMRKPDITIWV